MNSNEFHARRRVGRKEYTWLPTKFVCYTRLDENINLEIQKIPCFALYNKDMLDSLCLFSCEIQKFQRISATEDFLASNVQETILR